MLKNDGEFKQHTVSIESAVGQISKDTQVPVDKVTQILSKISEFLQGRQEPTSLKDALSAALGNDITSPMKGYDLRTALSLRTGVARDTVSQVMDALFEIILHVLNPQNKSCNQQLFIEDKIEVSAEVRTSRADSGGDYLAVKTKTTTHLKREVKDLDVVR